LIIGADQNSDCEGHNTFTRLPILKICAKAAVAQSGPEPITLHAAIAKDNLASITVNGRDMRMRKLSPEFVGASYVAETRLPESLSSVACYPTGEVSYRNFDKIERRLFYHISASSFATSGLVGG